MLWWLVVPVGDGGVHQLAPPHLSVPAPPAAAAPSGGDVWLVLDTRLISSLNRVLLLQGPESAGWPASCCRCADEACCACG
jgi:hypothetical protein